MGLPQLFTSHLNIRTREPMRQPNASLPGPQLPLPRLETRLGASSAARRPTSCWRLPRAVSPRALQALRSSSMGSASKPTRRRRRAGGLGLWFADSFWGDAPKKRRVASQKKSKKGKSWVSPNMVSVLCWGCVLVPEPWPIPAMPQMNQSQCCWNKRPAASAGSSTNVCPWESAHSHLIAGVGSSES